MVGFLVAVAVLCFIVFLYNYCSWKKSRKDRARISFNRFTELYSKNSWRWKLYGDCVRFHSYPFEYDVEFETYLDVLRYKWFRKKVAKERQKEKQNSNQKNLEKEISKRYGEEK